MHWYNFPPHIKLALPSANCALCISKLWSLTIVTHHSHSLTVRTIESMFHNKLYCLGIAVLAGCIVLVLVLKGQYCSTVEDVHSLCVFGVSPPLCVSLIHAFSSATAARYHACSYWYCIFIIYLNIICIFWNLFFFLVSHCDYMTMWLKGVFKADSLSSSTSSCKKVFEKE